MDSFLRRFVLQSTGVEKFNRYFCHLRVLREISNLLLAEIQMARLSPDPSSAEPFEHFESRDVGRFKI
jgi:hypothetical protein